MVDIAIMVLTTTLSVSNCLHWMNSIWLYRKFQFFYEFVSHSGWITLHLTFNANPIMDRQNSRNAYGTVRTKWFELGFDSKTNWSRFHNVWECKYFRTINIKINWVARLASFRYVFLSSILIEHHGIRFGKITRSNRNFIAISHC